MRCARAVAVLFAVFAPAMPVRAAFARVEIITSAPMAAPSAAVGASAAALPAPSLVGVQTLTALPPAFAAPMAAAEIPAALELPAAAADALPQPAAKSAAPVLRAAAEAAPADAGRLFDAAPAAPDFDALTPARVPAAPARWTPHAVLLKPVAAAVNAWNAARHQRRLDNPPLEERVTTEELGLRETLGDIHSALAEKRFQDAIDVVAEYFQTRAASSWYMENPGYRPYRSLALDYMRFAEHAVLQSYVRADSRGADAALVAEAREAALGGRILGHAWRPTAIQEKDSSLCVQNALFNAISASVGFARPTTVFNFVAASRAALNRPAKLDRPADPAEIAALANFLGVNLGRRDVGQGMGTDALRDWASLLGMKLAARGPPKTETGWSALLRPGQEVLLSLRMFHPKFPHSAEERDFRGHDYRVIHHEVYLLGAFDSPSRGERLFLLQDSGSGSTLMATADELSSLVTEAQILTTAGPVRVPR